MISILMPLYIHAVSFYIIKTKTTCGACFRSGFRVSVRIKVSYWLYKDKAEKVINQSRNLKDGE